MGYQAGEGITIKCNLVTQGSNTTVNNEKTNTPQVLGAVLDQLTDPVNGLGIAQGDISIYDDLNNWSTMFWDYYTASNTADSNLRSPQTRFPGVHWMDRWTGGSRNPSPMTSGSNYGVSYPWGANSYIPTYVMSSKYAIDMAVLSAHQDAGVTLCGKNYVGSIGETPNNGGGQNGTIHSHRLPGDASISSPTPADMGVMSSGFATFLANQNLCQKNILYMLDALYGGWNWGSGSAGSSTPTPWSMPPFGNGQVSGDRGWCKIHDRGAFEWVKPAAASCPVARVGETACDLLDEIVVRLAGEKATGVYRLVREAASGLDYWRLRKETDRPG